MKDTISDLIYAHKKQETYIKYLEIDFNLSKNDNIVNLILIINDLLEQYGDLIILRKNIEQGYCVFKPVNRRLSIKYIRIYKNGDYEVRRTS